MITTLRVSSCQAPNSEYIMRQVAAFLEGRVGVSLRYVDECAWPERYARLNTGDIHVAWICGAPYVRRMDKLTPAIELLVAPVWRAPRYADQPVYFSDVLVRNDHPAHSFAELRGATFAYNESGSLSGYEAMRFHLFMLGEQGGYFGRVVASGSHQQSLQLILAGQVDAAAIDTTVLEEELRLDPDLAHHVRTVATLGPHLMPPWVASLALPAQLRAALRQALVAMHEDPAGAAILAATPVARFAPVTDEDYAPVRRMLRLAEQITL